MSDTASLETEVFERRITFPLRIRVPNECQDENVNAEEQTPEKEASLNHVLTNVVILQEFVLEVAALIHARASLVDGEVKFL